MYKQPVYEFILK